MKKIKKLLSRNSYYGSRYTRVIYVPNYKPFPFKKIIICAIIVILIIIAINLLSNSNNNSKQKDSTLYNVIEIIDGDTIKVSIDNKNESVRLIGINAPETVNPNKPIECFGKEATESLNKILIDRKVKLYRDRTQSDRDKYNRLLRYVNTNDGTDVGYVMIENGYAREFTYNSPYMKQTLYKKAELYAIGAKKGMWSFENCQNNIKQTTSNKSFELDALGHYQTSTFYANCASAVAAGVAPIYRNTPGYREGLDRDLDGIACEPF